MNEAGFVMFDRYICESCGGDMVRDRREDAISYKGLTKKILQPGWYCTNCEEVILTPEDAKISDIAYRDLQARVEGASPGE